MTAALEGGEWSAARPGRTLTPGKTRYPFYRRLGGSQGRSGRVEDLVPTGIRSRNVQPVVSRYTDWATRPTIRCSSASKKVHFMQQISLLDFFFSWETNLYNHNHTNQRRFLSYLWFKHPSFLFLLFVLTKSNASNQCTFSFKGKGKAVPLQAWSGPVGSRKLRFPDFMTTAQDGGKVVSLRHRPPLPPGNTAGTHFC